VYNDDRGLFEIRSLGIGDRDRDRRWHLPGISHLIVELEFIVHIHISEYQIFVSDTSP